MTHHGYYTMTVQDLELVAVAEAEEFKEVRIPCQQARRLGHDAGPDGKVMFGRVSVHKVIRDGQPAEPVTVFTCSRGAVALD